MEKICDKEKCTGCGLCISRCPKKCITMQSDYLGHLYPFINQYKCIDCGLCKKGCPSLHILKSEYPKTAYAAWAKDFGDYKTSTSGGVASIITNYILSNGGIVYGCSVLTKIKIEHIRIDNIADAYKLKGSKYVQSNIINVLPQIIKDVRTEKQVLFIGTPCQVAAVKQMFKEIPDNLFLIDIICHGVPSNNYLINYITKNLGIKNNIITNIKFRTPDEFSLCIYSNDKLIYKSNNLWTHRYEDLYYNTFIDGFTYRESCYKCNYAKPERISDITIGDFWGLGESLDDSYIHEHKYGISCVLPITDKGKQLINIIKNKMNIYERPVQEAVNGNSQLKAPKIKNWRICFFRCLCKNIPISFSYKLSMADKIFKYKIKNLLKS